MDPGPAYPLKNVLYYIIIIHLLLYIILLQKVHVCNILFNILIQKNNVLLNCI